MTQHDDNPFLTWAICFGIAILIAVIAFLFFYSVEPL
jgi:hypothetical protein